MATAQLSTTKPLFRDKATTTDWVITGSAMAGAVLGAFGGVSAAGGLGSGLLPAVLGTVGTMLGSVSAAMLGHFAILPLWTKLTSRQ